MIFPKKMVIEYASYAFYFSSLIDLLLLVYIADCSIVPFCDAFLMISLNMALLMEEVCYLQMMQMLMKNWCIGRIS